jgi:hypothetical protein
MLQAHSILWHYLWIAPNILCLVLAVAVGRSSFRTQYPLFFSYLIFSALEGICLYALDVSPKVSAITWWRVFWGGTIVDGLLKFAVVAELLHHLLHSWPAVARLGRNLVSGAGALLVLLAAVAAAFAAPDNTPWLVGGAHVLSQTLYLTVAGLILSIFMLAASFRIPWERSAFGVALGAGVVWCEHLAVWALVAGGVVRNRGWEDIANMGAFHLCVLVWFYYLLVPSKATSTAAAPLPESNLDVWNRELERLVHPRAFQP